MIKHIEIKTIEHNGINVTVKINYDKREISIIERNGYGSINNAWKDKHYVFAGRGLEYMNGWKDILDSVKFAIDEASKELSLYIKEKDKENENEISEVFNIVSDMIKGKTKK